MARAVGRVGRNWSRHQRQTAIECGASRVARAWHNASRSSRRLDASAESGCGGHRASDDCGNRRVQCPRHCTRATVYRARHRAGCRHYAKWRAARRAGRFRRAIQIRLTRSRGFLMIAVFDVGNSEITIGIFNGHELISHWRLTTAAPRTADELAILIRSITGDATGASDGITGSAICSVVPAITPMLVEACEMCFERRPIIVDARAKLPVKLDVEEPFTVGAD